MSWLPGNRLSEHHAKVYVYPVVFRVVRYGRTSFSVRPYRAFFAGKFTVRSGNIATYDRFQAELRMSEDETDQSSDQSVVLCPSCDSEVPIVAGASIPPTQKLTMELTTKSKSISW